MPGTAYESPLLEAIPWMVVQVAADGTVLEGNRTWRSFVVANPRTAPTPGQPYLRLFDVATRRSRAFDRFERAFSSLLAGGDTPARFQFSHGLPGHERWFEISATPVPGAEPEQPALLVVHDEITESKCLERALIDQKERSEVTLDSIADGVIRTDAQGRVEYMNRVAQELTGWDPQAARGRPFLEICTVQDEHGAADPQNLVDVIHWGDRDDLGTLTLHSRTGHVYGIRLTTSAIRERQGRMLGFVFALTDVTAARRIAQELERKAHFDSLTNLVNRREFYAQIERALAEVGSEPTHREHVLCYLDLDQFKVVNDTCGHPAGDELLRQVARILRTNVRESDVVGRLGGDEFAFLLRGCDLDQAYAVAESVRQAICNFRFTWQSSTFHISVSIGLVKVSAKGLSLDELVSAADTACYAAKNLGRNNVQIHRAHDGETSRLRGSMDWVSQIEHALEDQRFQVFAQPIVPTRAAAADDQRPALELLARLDDGSGKTVLPGAFLPSAERYGMVQRIDAWMLERALETLGAWESMGACFQMIAVNLSGVSLCDERFVDEVAAKLGDFPSARGHLCFEITETAVIANLGKARRSVDLLRAFGCRFALDDFGSGLFSFDHLRALNVDFVKIDGSFVRRLEHSETDRAIVESINDIAHSMGMKTVAEYVETSSLHSELERIGVDFVQGHALESPHALPHYLGACRDAEADQRLRAAGR